MQYKVDSPALHAYIALFILIGQGPVNSAFFIDATVKKYFEVAVKEKHHARN
jgi:hypothetical protein